jgi:hypothetical protein
MSKQDRQGARTASDLERKYNFGKNFEEVMGVATNAHDSAEKAYSLAQAANESIFNLDQQTIFNLLTNDGKAEGVYLLDGNLYINASYIGTGQLASKNFLDNNLTLIRYSYKELEATTYYFRLNENSTNYYQFTTTQVVPFGGSVRLYEPNTIVTSDSSVNVIETAEATITNIPAGTKLDLDVSVYFSENGTKIDLENGNIFSKEFSIVDGKAYFGGELEVNFGRVGAFDVSMRNMTATSLVGCATAIGDTGISFYSGVAEERYVDFFAGDPFYIEGLSSSDPHVVEIKNSNGDSVKVTPTSATMTGAWKATPYTGGDSSEIVTKQDLINLGLIS